jgi:hypothetical protein
VACKTLDMELAGIVVALFTCGYIIGVWTACLVLKQPQQAYEDGALVSLAAARATLVRAAGAERRL